MTGPEAADLMRAALRDTSKTLTRLPGRNATSGLHEVKELGPALRASLIREGLSGERVALNHTADMANWNRTTSQIDLVVLGSNGAVEIAAELKAWDIGHQLFDLAKVCCLLASGARAGFLICVAKQESDFDRLPGGELFPPTEGRVRPQEFVELIATHWAEWLRHVGKARPEPTAVPARLTTTGVAAGVTIDAYPGHSARAVQVTVTDPTPVPLVNGRPQSLPWPE